MRNENGRGLKYIFSFRCVKKDPKECFDKRDKKGINEFGAEDVLNNLISSAQDAKCLDEGCYQFDSGILKMVGHKKQNFGQKSIYSKETIAF